MLLKRTVGVGSSIDKKRRAGNCELCGSSEASP